MNKNKLDNTAAWLWEISNVGYLPEYEEDYTPEDIENAKMSGSIIACCCYIQSLIDA